MFKWLKLLFTDDLAHTRKLKDPGAKLTTADIIAARDQIDAQPVPESNRRPAARYVLEDFKKPTVSAEFVRRNAPVSTETLNRLAQGRRDMSIDARDYEYYEGMRNRIADESLRMQGDYDPQWVRAGIAITGGGQGNGISIRGGSN